VTVNQLVDIVEEIAGIKLKRRYDLSAPKGVNGEFGQHADSKVARVAAGYPAADRLGKNLPLDSFFQFFEHSLCDAFSP